MIYLVIALAFLADRLSKWWAAAYLAEHGITRLNSWLTLRIAYNRGIAFGMFGCFSGTVSPVQFCSAGCALYCQRQALVQLP